MSNYPVPVMLTKPAAPLKPDLRKKDHTVPGRIKRVLLYSNRVAAPGANYSEEQLALAPAETANIVSSKITDSDWHAPVLDLDIPHAYVSSTSEGHGHLYLDIAMPWKQYKKLLKALAKAGVIEKGYANASIQKGFSAARLPWIRKPNDTDS